MQAVFRRMFTFHALPLSKQTANGYIWNAGLSGYGDKRPLQ
jgi:hypothetical protein